MGGKRIEEGCFAAILIFFLMLDQFFHQSKKVCVLKKNFLWHF